MMKLNFTVCPTATASRTLCFSLSRLNLFLIDLSVYSEPLSGA